MTGVIFAEKLPVLTFSSNDSAGHLPRNHGGSATRPHDDEGDFFPVHSRITENTPMTSIFEGQPLKTRPFPSKTRVIWVLGWFRVCVECTLLKLFCMPCYVCLKWCQVIDVCVTVCVELMSCGFKTSQKTSPIPSMNGIFTCIWLIFIVIVGKYAIHGSYGSFKFALILTSSRTCKTWKGAVRVRKTNHLIMN